MQANYPKAYKENRKKIVFYLEPLLHDLAAAYASEKNWTLAEYCADIISKHLIRKDIATRPRGVKEGDIEPIIGAYKEGQYRQAILDKYRITETQLRTILRTHNVPRRDRVTVGQAIKKGLL